MLGLGRTTEICDSDSFFVLRTVSISSGIHNKVPQTSGLNDRHLFPHSLEAESSRSRCQQSWLLLRPLSLAGLSLASSLCPHVLCVSITAVSSSSYKDTSHIGLWPHPMTSFNFSYTYKGPISKYNQFGG